MLIASVIVWDVLTTEGLKKAINKALETGERWEGRLPRVKMSISQGAYTLAWDGEYVYLMQRC